MHSAWERALWKPPGPLVTRILEPTKWVAVWPVEVFHSLFPASPVQKARAQMHPNAPTRPCPPHSSSSVHPELQWVCAAGLLPLPSLPTSPGGKFLEGRA